jgi:selenocysteine lyase/cysteine desulfurase
VKRREFLVTVGATAGGLALPPGRFPAQPATQGLPDAGDPAFWPRVRSRFLLPSGFAYLNTAGLGASPLDVIDTVKARMDREEENPAPGHNEDDFARIRAKCASFLGPRCRAADIAFVSTATEGINAILNTIPLGRGDEIITSTHEHAGLAIPLLHKMHTTGCVVRTFEPDLRRASGNVERIGALLSARTRLVFVSHVTCTTGQLLPAAEIGRLVSARGITFALDGAQSLGHMPFDITDTGAHFYAASCHKWMMGPKRTGLLYIRADRQAGAVPSIVGAYSDAESNLLARTLTLRPQAQRFEYGTQNNALIYGLEAAADFITGIGPVRMWRRDRDLAERCVSGLGRIGGIELLSPAEAADRTAIVTFRAAGRDNRRVAASLVSKRLRVRSVTEGGLDAVRASFHACNDESEVDRLIVELRDLLRAAPDDE